MAGDRIWWIDPDGRETELTHHPNVMVLLDREGMDMPPFSFAQEQESASDFGRIETEARELDLLVAFRASSYLELRKVIRSFLSLFHPLRGNGKLRVQAPDGTTRELVCRYKAGLEGVKKRGESGKLVQKSTITFTSSPSDPYWYDTQEIVQTFELTGKICWFPLFPLRFGGVALCTEVQLVNQGDVEAFPVWTIRGPGMNPRLTNLSTGQMLALNGIELDPTQFITIRMFPRKSQILLNDGTDLFPYLSFGSTLWRLQPGRNIIRMEMPEANEESQIQFAFRPRYLGV